VHQDGLVHVSAMAKQFVSDPREVVKSGDVVRVKVLEIDEARKRISLTLRLDDEATTGKPERAARRGGPGTDQSRGEKPDQKRGDHEPGERPRGDRRREDRARGDRGRDDRGRDDRGKQDRGRDARGRSERTGGSGGSGTANSAMADALRRAGLAGGDKK
jgi:uncharacterized protein